MRAPPGEPAPGSVPKPVPASGPVPKPVPASGPAPQPGHAPGRGRAAIRWLLIVVLALAAATGLFWHDSRPLRESYLQGTPRLPAAVSGGVAAAGGLSLQVLGAEQRTEPVDGWEAPAGAALWVVQVRLDSSVEDAGWCQPYLVDEQGRRHEMALMTPSSYDLDWSSYIICDAPPPGEEAQGDLSIPVLMPADAVPASVRLEVQELFPTYLQAPVPR